MRSFGLTKSLGMDLVVLGGFNLTVGVCFWLVRGILSGKFKGYSKTFFCVVFSSRIAAGFNHSWSINSIVSLRCKGGVFRLFV